MPGAAGTEMSRIQAVSSLQGLRPDCWAAVHMIIRQSRAEKRGGDSEEGC